MPWKNIDWLDIEVNEYETALNDQVREAYLAAYSGLKKQFKARTAHYESIASEAEDEHDRESARDQLMYEDFRWSEQRKALTSMTLSMLASLNKSFLDREKSLFKNTHP